MQTSWEWKQLRDLQAGGWQITLNDRALKTPARQPLIVPSRQLAVAIAAEWEWQVSTWSEQADAAVIRITCQAK